MNKVIISEYIESWPQNFKKEADLIKSVVNSNSIYIDHVGSTSVKGILSKPIIDILISNSDWSIVKDIVSSLAKIGYCESEKCEETPRVFLKKYNHIESVYYHVHICKPESRWGRDMLIFKNILASDDEVAKGYAELKISLVAKHDNDIDGYANGKKEFIEENLRKINNEFGVNRLLSHQRAEADKASKSQLVMVFLQILIATITAMSVYSNNNKYLFAYAIIGFTLMIAWFYFNQTQLLHRSSGDQARRAVLLISGLQMVPSAEQRLRISDGFKVKITQDSIRHEEDHFSTREAPGPKRLTDMIEESSYWTRDLQKISSKVIAVSLFFLFAIVFLACGAAVASLESDNLISLSRVAIVVMIFIISSDVLGSLISYRNSASAIDEIFKRIEAISARGYIKSDVYLLMSDYNAAIERAPITLPWVYKFAYIDLNRRWHAYVDAKYLIRELNNE